ncbi:MAG: sugar-binding transcriptional regulator [Spirochaetes bacterium]|nr:sugar-binding transcriptional regulator [Spirochaetota bacterium]
MKDDNKKLLMNVAKLYYLDQLNQKKKKKKLNTSRSTVSRLLKEAREEGIVKIKINFPWERDTELERELKKTFQLKEARVLTTYDQPIEDVILGIGFLAAEYLNQIIHDDITLAVSYGRSVFKTIQQLKSDYFPNMNIIQLIGALGKNNLYIDSPDLVKDLASVYHAKYQYLHTPLVVEDVRTHALLQQESSVQKTLNMAKQADIAILGIGSFKDKTSGIIWKGFLHEKDIIDLKAREAVGHICAQFYDIQGKILNVEIHTRTIGIGAMTLRNIPSVIAVAGGEVKAEAILGAIRGQFLNILITDDQAARKILELQHRDNVEKV